MNDVKGSAEGAAGPIVKIVSTKTRLGTYELEYPVEVDGKLVEAIVLKRMTGAEVVALSDLQTREDFDDNVLLAMVCDQPAAVIRALDQDDWLALRDAALDFLPRRFRAAVSSPGDRREK